MSFHIGPLHYSGIVPLVALLVLVYGVGKALIGRDARRILKIGFLLIIIGWLIYWIPYVTLDFSLKEVYWDTSPGLPLWMRFAAAWAGGGGSLFLFTLIASLASLYVLKNATRWLQVALGSITIIGLVAAFLNDAFTALPSTPPSGAGLNPLLKSPWLYPHPLSTFSGYALLAIAAAALLAGQKRKGYTLYEIGWAFLTLGILLGGYWSYETFGWGGYWAWDPVETSELMVWLAATLLPHILYAAPSLADFSESLIASSVFLAMYVTRTGLSPLHSFAAPSIGAMILLITGYSWLLLAAIKLYFKLEPGIQDLVNSLRSGNTYRVGITIAALSLLAATLFVYSTLLVPATVIATGKTASVPQMSSGIRYFHPVLYPLLITLLAAMPAVFLGEWLGWRGYFALLVTTGLAATALGLAAYYDKVTLAPLSPLGTNAEMAFGLVWAGVAAASTLTYLGLRARRGLRVLLRDRLGGLSLLHLGLAITVIGVLLSGTYAFNQAYMKTYHVKPGQEIDLPGGFKLVFKGFKYSISHSKVDIYTRYVNHATSYYYGQLALYTLAQDFARTIQSYEKGKIIYKENPIIRTLINIASEKTIFYPGNYTIETRATIRYINFASNITLLLTNNEPVKIKIVNMTLEPLVNQDPNTGKYYLYMPIQGNKIEMILPRNISKFITPELGVHAFLAIQFTKPARIITKNLTIIINNASLLSEQFITGGQGAPLRVKNNTITGSFAVLDIRHAKIITKNGTTVTIPAQIPTDAMIYYSITINPTYKKILEAIKETGLYKILVNPNNILKLAFTQKCINKMSKGASFAPPSECLAYVRAPKLVPETAWLKLRFELIRGHTSKEINTRIRYEAYGEIQGIHGLVPKVIHPGEGIDEVYIVLEPPMINSFLYGDQMAYHELFIYYLHEVFKNLTPPQRLALAAVMIGGYESDMLRTMSEQQAQNLLEGSLVDVYILASKFSPTNSTIYREGLLVKVKIVPGVRLVWIGPVIMAASALYLAGFALFTRRESQ